MPKGRGFTALFGKLKEQKQMRKKNPWLHMLPAGAGLPIDRKILQKQADDLFSECVKLRDKSHCTRCLKTSSLNCHHIFSRKHKATRYLLENGITLCRSCHKFVAHSDSELFRRWVIESKRLSQAQFDTMFGLAYGSRPSPPNYPVIIESLKKLRGQLLPAEAGSLQLR